MKLDSTRLEAQTLLPKARVARRNQSVSKSRAAAPERKKSRHSTAFRRGSLIGRGSYQTRSVRTAVSAQGSPTPLATKMA